MAGAEPRLRRTLLMAPGHRAERLRKALSCGADSVVFDLEDGVPPAQKAAARQAVAEVLRETAGAALAPGVERCVRINALASGLAADDLAALPLEALDAVMVPKVESAAEVRALEALLAHGPGRELPFVLTLETPLGVLRALEIAQASARTTALFFGSGDYTAATGSALSAQALLVPRSLVAAAAAAVGAQAIDAAFFENLRDEAATRADAQAARELGFAGKVVFHPAQVAAVNAVFSPSPQEVARARELLDAWAQSQASGAGTALVNGRFVAVDLVEPARRVLRRADAVAAREAAPRGRA